MTKPLQFTRHRRCREQGAYKENKQQGKIQNKSGLIYSRVTCSLFMNIYIYIGHKGNNNPIGACI